DLTTDFRIKFSGDNPALFYKDQEVTPIYFMKGTDFFNQKTSSGMPFVGNSVLQGCDWVAFQCLWPCEYAQSGKACQFCFSGGQFETLAKKNKPMPFIPSPQDVAEVVSYAVKNAGVNSIQITGGSTFDSEKEYEYIKSYMEVIDRNKIDGEILLYITPPDKREIIDEYFQMGVDRIACSLEVWDDDLAAEITPGKRGYTTKKRHLDALTYIADTYGPGKAFSNFIIGLEPIETLREGAEYLASRGIIPSASVWMPFGKPVRGSMKAADLEYFRAVKEMLGELYLKYNLTPAGNCGLNVCIERDIWRWAHSEESSLEMKPSKSQSCSCKTATEHNTGCLICGKPLEYSDQSSERTCSICGQKFQANVSCVEGHYVCDRCHSYGAMVPVVNMLRGSHERDPLLLLESVMELQSVHMHGPEHHGIVPMVLLTACRNNGLEFDYDDAIRETYARSSQLPGGTCGFWGVCGAASGAGIFVSIIRGINPLSTEEWGKGLDFVADCLHSIGKIGGPRCCKRTSRTAIIDGVKFAEREFGLSFPRSQIKCTYVEENEECIGIRCPYFG
ncbi:MAG: DUF5714 domain-containing protein, partial [Bacillota bacterium]|nr:DUF5714 domain-containing protein [Bacillota bacterium]